MPQLRLPSDSCLFVAQGGASHSTKEKLMVLLILNYHTSTSEYDMYKGKDVRELCQIIDIFIEGM